MISKGKWMETNIGIRSGHFSQVFSIGVQQIMSSKIKALKEKIETKNRVEEVAAVG
jgi:hypothetical protein